MTSRCLGLACLLLVGCDTGQPDPEMTDPTAPRAAEYRSARVDEALEAASEVVRTRGFSTLDDAFRGFVVEHTADVREQLMRSGTCYVVLAAASAAMRELDVRIYDSDGVEVVQDMNDGPLAALRFCPAQSGTYYVTIRASAGSGLYAVNTFRGPTGLDIRTDDLFGGGNVPEAREGR